LSDAGTWFWHWRTSLVALALIASPGVHPSAQSLTISTSAGTLRAKAPGFRFIQGEPLSRLRDGRSVRFDFELAVLARPGTSTIAQARHSFILSYDLWEERFAVTRIGNPGTTTIPATTSRSISHLTSIDAEAWCLDQLTIPVGALGRLGRDASFWIKLEYRVPERATSSDEGYTLRSLIDALSRRRKADELGDAIEAGPFRLTN